MEKNPFTQEELSGFCLGLAHLIHAGLSAGDALALLEQDESEPLRKEKLGQMARRADAGQALSVVLRDTGIFPGYIAAMTAAGEETGRLEEALFVLADYYESRSRMERQLRIALLQPLALLGVLLVVVVVLLGWVLPVFDDVYRQLGTGLTGVAGALLALGRLLRAGAPVLLVLGIAACVLLWRGLCTRRTPFIRADEAWLAQVLALALGSGLSPERAMTLAAELGEEDSAFRRRCRDCLERLQGQETLPGALSSCGLMPKADCRLLEAGLRSGCGDTVMAQLASRARERSEERIERRLSRIEPALVLGACALVGLILLSVLLPLIRIMAAIG